MKIKNQLFWLLVLICAANLQATQLFFAGYYDGVGLSLPVDFNPPEMWFEEEEESWFGNIVYLPMTMTNHDIRESVIDLLARADINQSNLRVFYSMGMEDDFNEIPDNYVHASFNENNTISALVELADDHYDTECYDSNSDFGE